MADPKSSATPATTTPKTEVYLGVAIQIDKETLYLEPKKAISDIKKYGMEVGLPEGKSISLGTVRSGVNGILDTISPGTKLPEKEDVPDILQSTFETLTSAEIAIDKFHVIIPGSESANQNTLYTVALSATWGGDKGALFGNVKLQGIYVEVSNEKLPADKPPEVVSK